MAIEIGKEVICLESNNDESVKKGKIYIVEGIKRNSCCGNIEINVGITSNYTYMICTFCNTRTLNDGYYKIERFAPIDDVEISELTEILEKEVFEIL